jgi:hypothetical protein
MAHQKHAVTAARYCRLRRCDRPGPRQDHHVICRFPCLTGPAEGSTLRTPITSPHRSLAAQQNTQTRPPCTSPRSDRSPSTGSDPVGHWSVSILGHDLAAPVPQWAYTYLRALEHLAMASVALPSLVQRRRGRLRYGGVGSVAASTPGGL